MSAPHTVHTVNLHLHVQVYALQVVVLLRSATWSQPGRLDDSRATGKPYSTGMMTMTDSDSDCTTHIITRCYACFKSSEFESDHITACDPTIGQPGCRAVPDSACTDPDASNQPMVLPPGKAEGLYHTVTEETPQGALQNHQALQSATLYGTVSLCSHDDGLSTRNTIVSVPQITSGPNRLGMISCQESRPLFMCGDRPRHVLPS